MTLNNIRSLLEIEMPLALTTTRIIKHKTSSAIKVQNHKCHQILRRLHPVLVSQSARKTPKLRLYVPLKYYQVLQSAKVLTSRSASSISVQTSGQRTMPCRPTICFGKCFTGTQPHLFVYTQSMAGFCAVIAEWKGCNRNLLPAKAKIFTVWLCKKKVS